MIRYWRPFFRCRTVEPVETAQYNVYGLLSFDLVHLSDSLSISFSWSQCQTVCLGLNSCVISADWPAFTMTQMQIALRGLALFVSGVKKSLAGMCGKPKFCSYYSVFKKPNRPKLWHPFRRFSDRNCTQFTIQIKVNKSNFTCIKCADK